MEPLELVDWFGAKKLDLGQRDDEGRDIADLTAGIPQEPLAWVFRGRESKGPASARRRYARRSTRSREAATARRRVSTAKGFFTNGQPVSLMPDTS